MPFCYKLKHQTLPQVTQAHNATTKRKHQTQALMGEAESYIDEARYARAFVNDKFRFDHWGRIKIRYALRQKGVSDFDTDDALALIDDDDYRQALADFIASRRRTTKGDTPYAVNQKIARAAITRGFEPQMVFDALSVE